MRYVLTADAYTKAHCVAQVSRYVEEEEVGTVIAIDSGGSDG